MPALKNIRHEKFVRFVVAGASLREAYERAGYQARGHSAESNAWRLLRNDVVEARKQELESEEVSKIMRDMGATIHYRVSVLMEATQATKVVSAIVNPKGRGGQDENPDANAGTVDSIEVPDWNARERAIDILNKMDNIYETKVRDVTDPTERLSEAEEAAARKLRQFGNGGPKPQAH